MRVYKFLNKTYGLQSLHDKRLKLSNLEDLNDPFELAPFDLADPNLRQAFFKTKKQLSAEKGIMCFSSDWCDPVIWAHYSDKHRGLCLGFEIPNQQGNDVEDECVYVSYVKDPLPFPQDFENAEEQIRYKTIQKILFTKFEHWEYEHEIRQWAPLGPTHNGLHFLDFDEKLQIVEVIVGARCDLKESEIRTQGKLSSEVMIIKARAAYDQFKMTEDEDWNNEFLQEQKASQ